MQMNDIKKEVGNIISQKQPISPDELIRQICEKLSILPSSLSNGERQTIRDHPGIYTSMGDILSFDGDAWNDYFEKIYNIVELKTNPANKRALGVVIPKSTNSVQPIPSKGSRSYRGSNGKALGVVKRMS